MKKIYAVSSGYYSDYHISQMFSTLELAQQWVDSQPHPEYPGDEYNIEEWELDSGVEEMERGYSKWEVTMLRNGDTHSATNQGSPLGGSAYVQPCVISWDDYPNGLPHRKHPAIRVTCFARDMSHAVKIASEKRTQMIADGEWE